MEGKKRERTASCEAGVKALYVGAVHGEIVRGPQITAVSEQPCETKSYVDGP